MSNPDLPFRLGHDIALNAIPDTAVFYAVLSDDRYNDYSFSQDYLGMDPTLSG
ncbi:uncharacterized protein BXZ73DRAFT_103076 [Epithele typhae]|uniref:uncharacterized protein n=1 Tax=Epithele typhae TaxID=378194 RepID=UPI00200725C9|nr:uncharacterized protein BXZ73DRAFT_103076 [Epithele typhae]KAH9925904.1 hypothetical protein BXZ73DRAFT_103076 [Epithele typhae]